MQHQNLSFQETILHQRPCQKMYLLYLRVQAKKIKLEILKIRKSMKKLVIKIRTHISILKSEDDLI